MENGATECQTEEIGTRTLKIDGTDLVEEEEEEDTPPPKIPNFFMTKKEGVPVKKNVACSTGDPHIRTFDGWKYGIGKDNVESGIHEGITYLRVGDKAKLLIPSYLAHGLVGDKNKIPPRATLVVDLHLIRLQ